MIFHLAAVVSGEAEADFEKGYAVNFDGTRNLFEAIRAQPDYRPRVIFASSIAVYGAPFPETIPDDFHLTPLTSYGTQKAMGELLLADYIAPRLSRRHRHPAADDLHPAGRAEQGGVGVLLEHPARAAGRARRRCCRSSDDVRHWHASPRAAVGFFRHALRLDTARLGPRRSLAMPGLSATVAEQIEALRRAAGDEAVGADPPRARPGDPAHRRRLGDAVRRRAGAGARLRRRRLVRRDHRRARRGRARRTDRLR